MPSAVESQRQPDGRPDRDREERGDERAGRVDGGGPPTALLEQPDGLDGKGRKRRERTTESGARRESLHDVVETLLTRSAYDDKLQEMFSLASKRAALQTQKTPHELEKSDSYRELTERLEELRGELDRTTDDLSERDFEVELRQLDGDG